MRYASGARFSKPGWEVEGADCCILQPRFPKTRFSLTAPVCRPRRLEAPAARQADFLFLPPTQRRYTPTPRGPTPAQKRQPVVHGRLPKGWGWGWRPSTCCVQQPTRRTCAAGGGTAGNRRVTEGPVQEAKFLDHQGRCPVSPEARGRGPAIRRCSSAGPRCWQRARGYTRDYLLGFTTLDSASRSFAPSAS